MQENIACPDRVERGRQTIQDDCSNQTLEEEQVRNCKRVFISSHLVASYSRWKCSNFSYPNLSFEKYQSNQGYMLSPKYQITASSELPAQAVVSGPVDLKRGA
jgi:hypothetical protein